MSEQAVWSEKGKPADRFDRIKATLLSEPVHLCPERALLVTAYFKKHDDPKEPMVIRKARALRYVLGKKSVRIFPDL